MAWSRDAGQRGSDLGEWPIFLLFAFCWNFFCVCVYDILLFFVTSSCNSCVCCTWWLFARHTKKSSMSICLNMTIFRLMALIDAPWEMTSRLPSYLAKSNKACQTFCFWCKAKQFTYRHAWRVPLEEICRIGLFPNLGHTSQWRITATATLYRATKRRHDSSCTNLPTPSMIYTSMA